MGAMRRYKGGKRLAAHLDSGNFGRCLSAVLFFGEDLVEGGALRTHGCVQGNCTNFGWQYDPNVRAAPKWLLEDANLKVLAEVPYKPGRLVYFLAETPHDVTAVTKGNRDVLFLWFSCAPTLINGVSDNGHIGVLEYLTKSRANVRQPEIKHAGVYGRQPIHVAAMKGYADIVDWMVRHSASPVASTQQGLHPLHFASTPDVVDTLMKHRANPTASSQSGKQPLHEAATWNLPAVAESLARLGANVAAKNRQGGQPLHEAAMKGHGSVAEVLLNLRANVAAAVEDQHGYHPIHIAARYGHLHVTKLLLKRSRKVARVKTKNGELPSDLASKQGHNSVVELLQRAQRRSSRNKHSSEL